MPRMAWYLLALVSALVQASEAYLEVEVSVVPVGSRVLGNWKPELGLGLALLHSATTFDLESLRLAHSTLRWDNATISFRDQTIFPTPHQLQDGKGSSGMFLGLQLSGLPTGVQSYFIVSIDDVLAEKHHKAKLSIQTPELALRVRVKRGRPRIRAGLGSCQCVGHHCACCQHLDIPQILLNDTGCVNLTYIPKPDYGLSVEFIIDNIVLWKDSVSLRNPPPMCFAVPHLREFASICLRFYDIREAHSRVHGCSKIEAKLYHVTLADVDLGCFNFPI